MTSDTANEIYDILVDKAGASQYWRDDFVRHMVRGTNEYRFQGNLGFGGKFYNDNRKWRIGCYSEDVTPERSAVIEEVNAILDIMKNR